MSLEAGVGGEYVDIHSIVVEEGVCNQTGPSLKAEPSTPRTVLTTRLSRAFISENIEGRWQADSISASLRVLQWRGEPAAWPIWDSNCKHTFDR